MYLDLSITNNLSGLLYSDMRTGLYHLDNFIISGFLTELTITRTIKVSCLSCFLLILSHLPGSVSSLKPGYAPLQVIKLAIPRHPDSYRDVAPG